MVYQNLDEFYEQELKDACEFQILCAISDYQRKIDCLKYWLESPDYVRNPIVHPNEKELIVIYREYIERAKQALAEGGYTYTPTPEEEADLCFQKNLLHLSSISYKYTSLYESDISVLTFRNDGVLLKRFRDDVELTECLQNKEELLERLKKMHIGEWLPVYNFARFNYEDYYASYWYVTFTYDNGCAPVQFNGNKIKPYNFWEFSRLFSPGMPNDL